MSVQITLRSPSVGRRGAGRRRRRRGRSRARRPGSSRARVGRGARRRLVCISMHRPRARSRRAAPRRPPEVVRDRGPSEGVERSGRRRARTRRTGATPSESETKTPGSASQDLRGRRSSWAGFGEHHSRQTANESSRGGARRSTTRSTRLVELDQDPARLVDPLAGPKTWSRGTSGVGLKVSVISRVLRQPRRCPADPAHDRQGVLVAGVVSRPTLGAALLDHVLVGDGRAVDDQLEQRPEELLVPAPSRAASRAATEEADPEVVGGDERLAVGTRPSSATWRRSR